MVKKRTIEELYDRWVHKAVLDEELRKELHNMAANQEQMKDAFYRDLTFGTGGLRGILGAGTNRINIYTIAKATQGLSNYLLKKFDRPSVVIGYDSRKNSEVFAKIAADVFSANRIHVYFWSQLIPVPMVSFATRYMGASAGVMITASHNPAKYNGYKVFGSDGCQITAQSAQEIQTEIQKTDIFDGVKWEREKGFIAYISEDIYAAFIETVKAQTMLKNEEVNKDISIVYTPLHGTGLNPILRTLQESGYTNVIVVKEQEEPDSSFHTCPYPNPEEREAMSIGLQYARKHNADILLATDPDCDRVGIAVKKTQGEYQLLSGNETGILLLDYICNRRKATKSMPLRPVMINTIVTTDLGEKIAANYGVETIRVLTGFKYIGEQIGQLELRKEENRFVFGFEESYGYLTGTYVRDKDGVGAAFMICEMVAYYRTCGTCLWKRLQELYQDYGYFYHSLHSYQFEGALGFDRMQKLMKRMRQGIDFFGQNRVESVEDYAEGLYGLPQSDVLKFTLENQCSIVIRPSGTEPKLKCYVCAKGKSDAEAREMEQRLCEAVRDRIDCIIHALASCGKEL